MLEQKERLGLQVQQMTLDGKMQQQKCTMIQSQSRELQAERDQAYLSRDEAQSTIARILAEKDALRSQMVELQESAFSLRARAGRPPGPEEKEAWDSLGSGAERSPPPRRRLCRMDALNPVSFTPCTECEDPSASSVRSRNAQPPSPESLRRREEVLYADGRTSAPPFLVRSRPKAIRLNGRVLSISFQGEALLGQMAVVGGNRTGVFVHRAEWHASQVHPHQLLDLQGGSVPNYYRNELSNKEVSKGRAGGAPPPRGKAVRIVSTGQQGRNPLWCCVSLMPYTLVTPHHPPICRPVLLLPSVLGRILDNKMADWQGFQLCEP
ncbi:unnamed protein product, partial [Menidia menidia]